MVEKCKARWAVRSHTWTSKAGKSSSCECLITKVPFHVPSTSVSTAPRVGRFRLHLPDSRINLPVLGGPQACSCRFVLPLPRHICFLPFPTAPFRQSYQAFATVLQKHLELFMTLGPLLCHQCLNSGRIFHHLIEPSCRQSRWPLRP